MAEVATKRMTFEDFAALGLEGPYELVNGYVEKLVPFSPFHQWTAGRINSSLDPYLEEHDPEGWWGPELTIPTVDFHGRTPDVCYYASGVIDGLDLSARRAVRVPTLAIEVVSESDPVRDLSVKRDEYARAGIPHYWILDPEAKTALTLVLRGGRYEVEGSFSIDDKLTSSLLPGWEVAMSRLFR